MVQARLRHAGLIEGSRVGVRSGPEGHPEGRRSPRGGVGGRQHRPDAGRIGEPAAPLRVNSRARDGVIEGLEAAAGRSSPYSVTPKNAARTPQFQRLFDWFVKEAASGRRASGDQPYQTERDATER